MGRAVVDLPNPLDLPPPATMSGTDDLLAQLAGDEIDRLLAEADAERPDAPAAAAARVSAAPPGVAVVSPASASEAAAERDGPDAGVAAAISGPAGASATPPAPVTDASDDLDSLLNELNQAGSTSPDPAPASPADAVGDAEPKSLTDQAPDVLARFGAAPAPPSAEPMDGVMSPAERDALNLATLSAETAAAERDDTAAAALGTAHAAPEAVARSEGEVAPALRPAVRVLEWINAPLSFVPDAARDTLGKVAILTLVNSIAVLIYVLFVRH